MAAAKLNVLLVEGNDDLWVVANLCLANQIPDPKAFFEIIDCKGYPALSASLPERLKAGNEKRLGILVDADLEVANRWASLRAILRRAGYSATPDDLPRNGLVLSPQISEDENSEPLYRQKIGVWIMPDNSLPGALEDFVRQLVPPEQAPLWDHAEMCVSNLPITPDPLTDNWRSKARIHSYLAWHEEPGSPLGQAILKRYLIGDTGAAQPFMNWLRRLFELDSAS